MAKNQSSADLKFFTSSISEPGATGNVRRPSFPGPADPLLCAASGAFTFSVDLRVENVIILIVKTDNGDGTDGGNPYASAADEQDAVMTGGVYVPQDNITRNSDGSGSWFYDSTLIANIDNDSQNLDTWNRISVYIDVTELSASAVIPALSQRLSGKQFQAVAKDSCTESHRKKKAVQPAADVAEYGCCPSPNAGLPTLPALEVCDGWIRYSFFSLSGGTIPLPSNNGFLLASPDCCETPLSGRQIAIATGTVDWRPRYGRTLAINSPLGIFDTSETDGHPTRRMQFSGLNKFCFFVQQLRNLPSEDPIRIPVYSTCRVSAQRILLNPQKPFYVQVNNVQDDRIKSDGTLDFWVKVIS